MYIAKDQQNIQIHTNMHLSYKLETLFVYNTGCSLCSQTMENFITDKDLMDQIFLFFFEGDLGDSQIQIFSVNLQTRDE